MQLFNYFNVQSLVEVDEVFNFGGLFIPMRNPAWLPELRKKGPLLTLVGVTSRPPRHNIEQETQRVMALMRVTAMYIVK